MAMSKNAKAVLVAGAVAAGVYVLANSRAAEAAADALGSLGGSDDMTNTGGATGVSMIDAYNAGAAAGYNEALLDVKATDNTDGGATSPSTSPSLSPSTGGSGSTQPSVSLTSSPSTVSAGDTLSSAELFGISPWTALAAATTVAAGTYTGFKIADRIKASSLFTKEGSMGAETGVKATTASTKAETSALKAPATERVVKGVAKEADTALDAGTSALKAAERDAIIGASDAAKAGVPRKVAGRVGGTLATTGLALFGGEMIIANADWSYDTFVKPGSQQIGRAVMLAGGSPELAASVVKQTAPLAFGAFVTGAAIGGATDIVKGVGSAVIHPVDTAGALWGTVDRNYEEHGALWGTVRTADELLLGIGSFGTQISSSLSKPSSSTSPTLSTDAVKSPTGVISQGGVAMSETGFLPRPTSDPMKASASSSSIPPSGTPIYAIGSSSGAAASMAAASGRNVIVMEQELNTGSAAHMALIAKANYDDPDKKARIAAGESRRKDSAKERLRETYAKGYTDRGVFMSAIESAEAQMAGAMIGEQNAAARIKRGHMNAATIAKYEVALDKIQSKRPTDLTIRAPRVKDVPTNRNKRAA